MENGRCIYNRRLPLSIFIVDVGLRIRAVAIKRIKKGSVKIKTCMLLYI